MHNIKITFSLFVLECNNNKNSNNRYLLDVDFLSEKRYLYLIKLRFIIIMIIVKNNNANNHTLYNLFFFQNVCMFSMLLKQNKFILFIFFLRKKY